MHFYYILIQDKSQHFYKKTFLKLVLVETKHQKWVRAGTNLEKVETQIKNHETPYIYIL